VRDQRVLTDYFFQFHRDPASAKTDCKKPDAVFAALGIKLHEQLWNVRRFPGLGWDFILDHDGEWPQVAVCREDKFHAFCAMSHHWASASQLTVKELEQAVGVMQWVSQHFAVGRPHVVSVGRAKQAGKVWCALHTKCSKLTFWSINAECHDAFVFWAMFLPRWNKICPLVQSFGPASQPHFRLWVDASTTEGLGGGVVVFDPVRNSLFGFYHVWSDDELLLAKRAERRSAPFLELLIVQLAFEAYGPLFRAKRVLCAVDAVTSMQSLQRSFSDTPGMAKCLRAVREAIAADFIVPQFRAVVGDVFNRLADRLSRLKLDEARALAWELFGVAIAISRR